MELVQKEELHKVFLFKMELVHKVVGGVQGGRRCTRCTRASWPTASASGHLRCPFSESQTLNFFLGSHDYTVAFVTPAGFVSVLQIILHIVA